MKSLAGPVNQDAAQQQQQESCATKKRPTRTLSRTLNNSRTGSLGAAAASSFVEPADQNAAQQQQKQQQLEESGATKKRPTATLNRTLNNSRTGSLGAASMAGRRFNAQKPYILFFSLVFTATLTSYYLEGKSRGDLHLQQQFDESQFVPPRLKKGKILLGTTTSNINNNIKGGGVHGTAKNRRQISKEEQPKEKKLDEQRYEPVTIDKPLLGITTSINNNNKNNHKFKGEGEPAAMRNMRQTSREEQPMEKKFDAQGDEPVKIDKPLNIVILYADDWRHDDLGIASNGKVHTPFLDWMSETQGIRFTHNCVTTSVCWISRATMNTGQYYSRHKATKPQDVRWYAGFNNTYPALLRKSGYHVAHVGKWHSAEFTSIRHYFHFQRAYHGKHWYPGNPKPIHTNERNENDALEMLRSRPKNTPFILTLAFFAPHAWDNHPDVYCPQNETFHLYHNITVKPEIDMEESFKRLPKKVFSERNEGRVRYRQRFSTPKLYGQMVKNYWRLISGVDAACESVWQELEAQGILNETMVIFTTDNGYYHGEHGLAGKWYPHEESIRVPLIVYDPRMPPNKKGTTDDSFTLNIDLAATIVGAANVSKPDTYQGRDISDLYLRGGPNNDNLSPPWRTEFYYEHPVAIHENTIPASSALVRKQIKYILWPNFDVEQLFNLTSDPMEEDDQIRNPEYASLLEELKLRHDALRDLAAREHTVL